jgi:peptide-methionine (S)-S-oxide reductase
MASLINRLFRPFTSAATTAKMSNAPATPVTVPEGAERATLAAGCFWGVEHLFRKHFGDKGLYDARVGYIGGDAADPSYKAVCSGNTGRAFHLPLLFPSPPTTTLTKLSWLRWCDGC